MTNSMKRRINLFTPENAAKFIPVLISSGLAILVIIFFVIPQYARSTKVNLELNELIKKKNELENLKSQYQIINQKFEKLNKEKLLIIELVSGNSNLDTLLAKLGEIGKNNKIDFISIVPRKIIGFIDNSSKANNNKSGNIDNIVVDPLLVEGTKKYLIDFTFRTDFINLLNFLREIEFQENVILLDDINLKLAAQNNNRNINNIRGMLEVKLSMTFYGKI